MVSILQTKSGCSNVTINSSTAILVILSIVIVIVVYKQMFARTAQDKKAELFFGQKWSGDTLAQLNTPASITFFQGSAYITDAMNSRILKLLVIGAVSNPNTKPKKHL